MNNNNGEDEMDKPKTEEEAKARIAELEGEARALKKQIAGWEEAIMKARDRHRLLNGRWDGGLIESAKRDLAGIQERDRHALRPPVVWLDDVKHPMAGYRIVKVTPKQVHIKRSKGRIERMRRADGWPIGSGRFGRIDVDACIAAMVDGGEA